MFVSHVFNRGIEGQPAAHIVASAEIDFLVSLGQIAIGQKHGIAEKRIAQEGAVIAAAHHVAAQAQQEFWPGITQQETASVRRATEGPVANQRRKRTNRNIGDGGIAAERWRKRRA